MGRRRLASTTLAILAVVVIVGKETLINSYALKHQLLGGPEIGPFFDGGFSRRPTHSEFPKTPCASPSSSPPIMKRRPLSAL
jgi:hypothetical protein